jgi:hypothetical protein
MRRREIMTEFFGTAAPLTEPGFGDVSQALGGNACSLWALITVETSGFGFLLDRRPKILFEQHWFHRLTNGRFDATDPDISSPQPGYPRGVDQYQRLGKAFALDKMAALGSTSWGLGQIMGFHASRLDYRDAADMVGRFCDGEDAQLDGILRFIAHDTRLESAFRAREWASVALRYNGPDYSKNEYDSKLSYHFDKYTRDGTPSIEVRTAQARLAYLGFNPHGIDGSIGIWTRQALAAFQKARGIAVTSKLDSATLDELAKAWPF